MIQMEYPKLPLDGLTPEEQIKALKRQVDILTDNLQIVLNSIEDDVGNVDNTSDKDKPISDAVQEALDEVSEALDTKVDKVTGKGLSTNDYTTSAKDKVDGIGAYVVETGTSGSWRYVKWSDGRAELWGWFSQSVTAYATNYFVIGGSSTTAYPFTITEPRTIVSGQKINNNGCYVSYDYGRTDYWSGIANPTAGITIAQGTTATVTWTCYVNARWR